MSATTPRKDSPKSNLFEMARPACLSGAFTTPRYLNVVTSTSPTKTLATSVTIVKEIERIGWSKIYIAFSLFAKVVPMVKTLLLLLFDQNAQPIRGFFSTFIRINEYQACRFYAMKES